MTLILHSLAVYGGGEQHAHQENLSSQDRYELARFSDIVYDCFRKPCDYILMWYKFAGEPGGVTELTSELEWNCVIIHVTEKIKTARTHAVTMELKNMVSEVNILDHEHTDLFF